MEKFFTASAFGFYTLTIVGMVAHAVKKWVNGEIEGHVFRWYMDNPRYTVGTTMTAMGATLTGIGAGLYLNISDATQIVACFSAAFAIDSFNKQ